MSDPANKLPIESLSKFGLDEIEARMYLHLLANGPQTPLNLSRQISLNRTRIYRYIEKLESKKLIEISGEPRGKKLMAASPSNLNLLLEEEGLKIRSQKEALPELLKDLSSLPTTIQKEFIVRHYRGVDGLKQMLWNQLAAHEIVAFSYKNKNDMVGKPFAEKIREEQVLKKVMLYELENVSDRGNYWFTSVANWGKYYHWRELPPQIAEIKQYIAVFNNTVSISHWVKGENVGIEIDNPIYAKMQRQVFWNLWDQAKGKEYFTKNLSKKARVKASKHTAK